VFCRSPAKNDADFTALGEKSCCAKQFPMTIFLPIRCNDCVRMQLDRDGIPLIVQSGNGAGQKYPTNPPLYLS
jgi:hypothetical protein